jgi:bifunctional non-homologous end joining protein LigD
MSLAKYQKMRDFARTSEPSGEALSQSGRSYVIQKHAASHLHYDFRLELGGVLLSWAVPKGPSLDPSVKRLAMQTEDHPVAYGSFEGTIPEGEYGGGTVMVWDRGTWEPEGDPEAGYENGHLTFQLHGAKLKGGWHLVRTHRAGDKQRGWLLFKARDAEARSGDTSLLEEHSKSALSGRDLDAIAGGPALPKKPKKRPTKAAKKADTVAVSSLVRAQKAKATRGATKPPTKIEPELATLVSETPTDEGFVHEVKFDGYRVLARIDGQSIRLLTRNGEDWTERMPRLHQALGKLKLSSAILDGEFVALDAKGLSDFQLLQNSFSGKSDAPLAYYAFDLLYLNGSDVRGEPLLARKAKLAALFERLPKSAAAVLRYSDHVVGNGAAFFAEAAKLGLEGVVSKRASSVYRSGRGKDWLKSKTSARQEFVIVGYTEPGGSRPHLGALLLGVRKGKRLVYAGKVGTGFSDRTLKDLLDLLTPLAADTPKLENAPRGAGDKGVHWVKPQLVAEVAFTGITHDGLLRHPTFKGLREDKPASDVVLEKPRVTASTSRVPSQRKVEHDAPASAAPPLTHPDKVLFPDLGITKRELYAYFEAVSAYMLPQVIDRPLTLLRCPEGSGKKCFFQKHPGASLAQGLRRVTVHASEGKAEYAAIEDERGLLSLVQMGVLEVHIWGARADDSEHPDQLVFDLDPDTGLPFKDVIAAARDMRALLQEYQLESWLKTTGGKGLHVTVPITPRADWDEVKTFCRKLAEELVTRSPERYLASMSKAKRKGKVFIDYLRNGRGQTFVAPYSTRARAGAGIAMPVAWDELSAKFNPEAFNVRSAEKYLAMRKNDPFVSLLVAKQQLPHAAASAVSARGRSKR